MPFCGILPYIKAVFSTIYGIFCPSTHKRKTIIDDGQNGMVVKRVGLQLPSGTALQ